jgi:glycogen(starch) synthase
MRILQFGVFPPPNGGVQTNIKAIRDYARQQGHVCGVVNLTRNRQPEADEVFYPHSPLEVFRLAARYPADILHFHLGGTIMPRLLALYLFGSLMPGRKTVLTFHSGGYPSSPEGRAAKPASVPGFVFRRMDAIIAVNAEIAALFRRFGVNAAKIHNILPHAFPAEPPTIEWPERLRQFMANHSPLFVTVGLLEPEYDLPLQIEAMAQVLERYPNAGLVIAGSGSREASLQSLIASKPYADHILLYGDLHRDITLNLIVKADAFLRTTLYDGDSVSVREALHFGTPVIATENGMRPEGTRNFPIADQTGLVRAIFDQMEQGRKPFERLHAADNSNLQRVLDLYAAL